MTFDTQVRRTYSPWTQLVFISLAIALVTIDTTIVNVSISDIQQDLALSTSEVQWVQEIYALLLGAGLLVSGALADHFGRRRFLIIGLAVFGIASLGAAASPTGAILIASRSVQGIGAALMLPTTLALINTNYRGRERTIAFGVWGATIASMAGAGLLLGGWLATDATRRLSFLINVPLALVIIIGSKVTIPESREPGHHPVDLVGAVLSVLAFGPLIFGLIEVRAWGVWSTLPGATLFGSPWDWPVSPFPIMVLISFTSATALATWVRVRNAQQRPSLLEPGLFRSRTFRNGTLVALMISLGEFGLTLILPLWLAFVLGLDPLQSGVVIVPIAVGALGSALLVRPLVSRIRPLTIVRIGLATEIVAIATIGALVWPGLPSGVLSAVLLVYGVGIGFASSQIAGVVLADIPTELSGQGAGMQSTARQIGTALGIAVLGTVLFTTMVSTLTTSLAQAGVDATTSASVISGLVSSAGSSIRDLPTLYPGSNVHTLAIQAYSTGTRMAAFTAAALLMVALAATVSVHRGRDEPEKP